MAFYKILSASNTIVLKQSLFSKATLECPMVFYLSRFYSKNGSTLRKQNSQRHKSTQQLRNGFLTQSRNIIIGRLGARLGGGDFKDEVEVMYKDGLPVLLVPMPSRRERCQFTMKPLSHTVGDFIHFLKEEDGGVDRAVVFSTDGYRVAQSTSIGTLMQHNFKLEVNDKVYSVTPPEKEPSMSEDSPQLEDIKALLCNLYSAMHVEQHQLRKEQQLIQSIEQLKLELIPLEQTKSVLEAKSARRVQNLSWLSLAYMGVQMGVLARLTWWEYSWDVMEPVTYFVTYGTAIGIFGFFLLTRVEYLYPAARDRQFLKYFYERSKKTHFNVKAYNRLRNELAAAERELRRLRDPLKMRMPIQQIKPGPLQVS